jgi:hypothetical protein
LQELDKIGKWDKLAERGLGPQAIERVLNGKPAPTVDRSSLKCKFETKPFHQVGGSRPGGGPVAVSSPVYVAAPQHLAPAYAQSWCLRDVLYGTSATVLSAAAAIPRHWSRAAASLEPVLQMLGMWSHSREVPPTANARRLLCRSRSSVTASHQASQLKEV